MTERQYKELIASFNDTTKEMMFNNAPLVEAVGYIALNLWLNQVPETHNSLLLRYHVQNYYKNEDWGFDAEVDHVGSEGYL